jgi:hypothetical protein
MIHKGLFPLKPDIFYFQFYKGHAIGRFAYPFKTLFFLFVFCEGSEAVFARLQAQLHKIESIYIIHVFLNLIYEL